MSIEWMSSHLDEWPSLKDSPEYQKKLDERVKQVEKDIEYSKQLTKVNDVLNVLDFPDNKEEAFRNILEKQDNETLKELATKSKNEILIFVTTKNSEETSEVKEKETQKQNFENQLQNEEYKKNDLKYEKIKNILPKWVYDWNPEFKSIVDNLDSFEALKTWIDTKETINNKKAEILDTIINELKNPKVLKSAVELLWWADKNNPKYVEFKNTLIWLDPSFENEFNILENTSYSINSVSNEVVNSIETDSKWLMKVDLSSDTPTSKMSLVWSEYGFTEKIDKQALTNINEIRIDKLTGIENSFAIFKGLYKPFGGFINQIKQDLWKQDFKQTIKSTISNFSQDIFSGLDEHYETIGIESSMQLSEADITSFSSIDSPSDLQQHIDRITAKFQNIEVQVWKMKTWVLQNHKTQMKELLEMESEQQEKQKKVLEFLKKSGFDLIPKEITNRIIRELQSNTLTIPWLDLSVKNIDIKNWNFWESGAFIDKEAWLNIGSKTNLVKFMNKLISWNIDEPLSVEGIANWISVSDPAKLKSKFIEANVVGGMWWKYGRIIENLRKDS